MRMSGNRLWLSGTGLLNFLLESLRHIPRCLVVKENKRDDSQTHYNPYKEIIDTEIFWLQVP